jgi:hypothetical protein
MSDQKHLAYAVASWLSSQSSSSNDSAKLQEASKNVCDAFGLNLNDASQKATYGSGPGLKNVWDVFMKTQAKMGATQAPAAAAATTGASTSKESIAFVWRYCVCFFRWSTDTYLCSLVCIVFRNPQQKTRQKQSLLRERETKQCRQRTMVRPLLLTQRRLNYIRPTQSTLAIEVQHMRRWDNMTRQLKMLKKLVE